MMIPISVGTNPQTPSREFAPSPRRAHSIPALPSACTGRISASAKHRCEASKTLATSSPSENSRHSSAEYPISSATASPVGSVHAPGCPVFSLM